MAFLFSLLDSDSRLLAAFQRSFSGQGQLGAPRISIPADCRLSLLSLPSLQQRRPKEARGRIFFDRLVLRFAGSVYRDGLPLDHNSTRHFSAIISVWLVRVGW